YEYGLSHRQLQQVLDYIDANLGNEIKLADLAKIVGISQFYFGRLFKQSLGLSPYQYLLQQRVERAKKLLKTTEQPIIDIAFDCGFNSHSHLSTQFRQLTGMTPKADRTN
ncbi:MAG: helix-turn-helix transcriptional regulator, partial [Sphaerospermopsis sp. SIO1G2]|nr:helix-turn-helix transcriptional regulator [Sphaerospermopsis sp. SIO1G2]